MRPSKILHALILLNLLVGWLYDAYMVFFVVRPPSGKIGALAGAAAEMPFELMVTRRLYAIESWVVFGALAVYLAITELVPRWSEARR